MREIKFRAWDGNKYRLPESFAIDGNGKITDAGEYDEVIINPTIEQFTGLLTADDRLPVFEGDKVSMHQFDCFGGDVVPTIEGFVEYEDESACFGLRITQASPRSELTVGDWFPINHFYGLHEESFTIIGNIHEPPKTTA